MYRLLICHLLTNLQISDACVIVLCKQLGDKLQQLILRNCKKLTNSVIRHAKLCVKLELLDIRECQTPNASDLHEINNNLSNINVLY